METKYIVSWSTPGLAERYKQFATRECAMTFANHLRDLNRAHHCLSIFIAKVEEEIR